jgi:hypothetical protein
MTSLPQSVTFRVQNQLWTPNDLVHSTETPGGYRECKFSLPSNGRLVGLDDKLVIYDSENQAYPFIGHISRVHKTGLCYDFTAVRSTRLLPMEFTLGPADPSHPSGIYAGKIYKAGTQMVETLRDALQLCDNVFDGGINTLSGLQYVADSQNIAGYVAEQIWNYVASLLGNLSTPLVWHIRGQAGLQVVVIDYADYSNRYRVELPEDQIDEEYDGEQIITGAAAEWGNDQVVTASLSSPAAAGRRLRHEKYLNASRDITRRGDADGLVGSHISQFGQFRSTGGQLTIKASNIVIHVGVSNNWPLWLVESGRGTALLNRPTTEAPYTDSSKYIIGTEYNWDSCELVCTTGYVGGGIDSRVLGAVDYNVNRLFNGPYNGPPGGNHPLADADLLPQVGPELTGEVPPSTSYAIPGFKGALDPDDPEVKYKKQLDPDIVPDEGLEANINFDPTTVGFQAAIRVTPGTFSQYRLLVGDDTGLVADAVSAELYRVIPITENPLGGAQFLTTITSAGLKDRTATIVPVITLKRGDFAMIKVTVPGATATWAALSLHAKKNFPRLKP